MLIPTELAAAAHQDKEIQVVMSAEQVKLQVVVVVLEHQVVLAQDMARVLVALD
jgi:hypothetical protein